MLPLIGSMAVLVTVVVILKLLLESRTRHKLIEKGMVDERTKYLYDDNPKVKILSSLKWALVLVGIGLGILLGQRAPHHLVEEYTVAGMCVFAGLGLVVYYVIAAITLRSSDR
jgi:hypothetical protein